METILPNDYIKQETLYKTGPVEVFKAVLKRTGQEIAVKKLKFLSNEELNAMHQEGLTMAALEHPNFVKLYAISREDSGDHEKFILLFMEYFPRGDLSKEIKRRIANNEYWPEEELWNDFKSLIQAHSFLQRQRIAHRDIKPQNIFVGNDSTLKVADLGCALQREEQERTMASEHTIAGTPLYLSPKLREAYMNFNCGLLSSNSAKHDPFKSDVYSLGLTFLYMASLKELNDLVDLKTVKYKISQRISELRYSERVKDLLTYMLEIEEAKRLSFIDLEELFSSSVEENMQLQPKFKTINIKARQLSDFRMLQNSHSIRVFFKISYIRSYSSYILQIIKNEDHRYYVWALITLAQSMNVPIKVSALDYKCYICGSGSINYLFECNCRARYLIHQECWNQEFICPSCRQSNVFWNKENSYQQQYQAVETKENDELKTKNDTPFDTCLKCQKQRSVFIFTCKHRICQNCLEKIDYLRKNTCFSCPMQTENSYEKLMSHFPNLKLQIDLR